MNEEKKKETTPSQAPAVQSAAVPEAAPEQKSAPAPAAKEEKSLGEKWYDRILYQGVNYWLNLGLSLVITDFFLHGKGKEWFHKRVGSATDVLASTGHMKRSTAKWISEIGLGTFSLNSGGNILLWPTKVAEDNKRYLVHLLNDKLGVDQTAPDGHKLTPSEIYIENEQDPQSWPRMIGRRVLGWGATTVTGLTLDRVLAKKHGAPGIFDEATNRYTPGQKVFTDKALEGANYVLGNFVPGGKHVVASPTAQRYMGYAALDWIYTIITSKILHATNGAHKKKKQQEAAEKAKTEATTVDATAEAAPVQPAETAITPTTMHAAEELRKKDKDEGFAAALAKQSEAAAPTQLGA